MILPKRYRVAFARPRTVWRIHFEQEDHCDRRLRGSCARADRMRLEGRRTEPAEPERSASSSGYTVTDASKLKSLSVGESAVWRDYEVAVKSIDRATTSSTYRSSQRTRARKSFPPKPLSFGMPPVSSTFANNTISVPAGETASGTLTFDDRYSSQRCSGTTAPPKLPGCSIKPR